MAEVSQQRKDGLLQPGPSRLHQEAGPTVRTSTQPSIASPTLPSKEALSALYQQRQKVELRRLLKHTHPELRSLESLDGVVDQELAEVLCLETQPIAGETGYEGEVLSRRLIFENCVQSNTVDPHTSKMHIAEGAGNRVGADVGVWGDVKRTSALFELPWYKQNLQEERVKETTDQVERTDAIHGELTECEEEEMVRLDVQSARRLFESQQVDTLRANQEDVTLNKVIVSEDERGAVQERKQVFETRSSKTDQKVIKSQICFKNLDVSSQSEGEVLGVGVNSADTEVQPQHEGFSTVKQVFERKSQCVSNADVETSPRIPKYPCTSLLENQAINTTGKPSHMQEPKPQNTSSLPGDLAPDRRVQEDMLELVANVRNRAQLFESTLFDLINHHNREEMEMVAESINETLNSLYHFNALHSHGSIIKASETGSGQKARYRLTPGLRPEIEQEKVAEGRVKNFILQLLPRATLKPQVVYLKEDAKRNVEVTMVMVPFHQVRLASNQDKEFRTANVVQLIEDILSQDSSLRKGVVIQEDGQGQTEVTVYSLYNDSEGEVERYYPPQEQRMETNVLDIAAGDEIKTETGEVRRGDVKSTISCLLATSQDHSAPATYKPEVNVMGNVKLFRSCIEKGDLEYLKTLQVQPDEKELPLWTDVVTGVSTEPKIHNQQQQPEDQVEQNDPDIVLKKIFLANQSCAQQNETKAEKTSKAIVQDQHTSVEKIETCSDSVIKTSMSQTSTEQHQEEEEEVVRGNVQAALQSLEKTSGVNVSQGDFEAAMICRKSPKSQKGSHKKKTIVRYAPQHGEVKTGTLTEAQPAPSVVMSEGQAISVKSSDIVVDVQQTSVQKEETSCNSVIKISTSHSSITSEHEPTPCRLKTEEASCAATSSEELQNAEALSVEVQEGTEVVQRGHLKAAMKSLQSATTEEEEEEKEEVLRGNLQAALHSLEKTSGVNVSQGDFKAAMIYRNSGKSTFQSQKKKPDMSNVPKHTELKTGFLTEAQPFSSVAMSEGEQVATKELRVATAKPPSPDQTTNKLATASTLKHESQTCSQSLAPSKKKKRPVGPKPGLLPKPAVPPKPGLLPKPAVPLKPGQMTGRTASQSTETEVHISDSHTISIRTTSSISSIASTNSTQPKESTKSQTKESNKSQTKESTKCQQKESTKTQSKESTKSKESKKSTKSQSKEEQPPQTFTIKPKSYADALCRGLQQTDSVPEAHQSRYVSERPAGSSVGTADTGAAEATQHTGDATQLNEEMTLNQEVQGSELIPQRQTSFTLVPVEESNTKSSQERTPTEQGQGPQGALKDKEKVNEDFIGFQAALQNFGGKSKAPVKPKQVKMTQSEENQKHTSLTVTHTAVGQQASDPSQPQPCSKPENNIQKEEKENTVVMREKKAEMEAETEDERGQRLSVHMDKIMRGNVTMAMEIFDNLRKQKELKEILTWVEEVEEDTSQVDVRALRNIFENIPDWVVAPRDKRQRKQQQQTKVEQKISEVKRSETLKDDTETSMSSMALVFGNLERASEEIMNLKEQTLARLMDIEVAVKKALYSVSTLKSDSDIAVLSGLFKESLKGTAAQTQGSTSNISTISTGSSSRAKTAPGKDSPTTKTQIDPGLPADEGPVIKSQSSPPSSFISIQSATKQESEDRQQESADRQKGSAARQQESAAKQESEDRQQESADIQKGSAARQQESADRQKGSAARQQESADRQKGSAARQQESAAKQESEHRQQESADRQQESADRQKGSAARQKSSLQPPLCSACQLSLKCRPSGSPCSRSPLNQKHQVSVLEVKIAPEWSEVVDTKTVREN
ncbi:xin actin-binding repeat-containing protein 1-like [Oncorhynchus kisutch]|nr:xin actin-binding repeat-containing protein 1-like [Oncorhynchus kisutch]XP_031652790.1 xin actin-binding repeat-containing protein 1-like [Oncorhynchus kisutch]